MKLDTCMQIKNGFTVVKIIIVKNFPHKRYYFSYNHENYVDNFLMKY